MSSGKNKRPRKSLQNQNQTPPENNMNSTTPVLSEAATTSVETLDLSYEVTSVKPSSSENNPTLKSEDLTDKQKAILEAALLAWDQPDNAAQTNQTVQNSHSQIGINTAENKKNLARLMDVSDALEAAAEKEKREKWESLLTKKDNFLKIAQSPYVVSNSDYNEIKKRVDQIIELVHLAAGDKQTMMALTYYDPNLSQEEVKEHLEKKVQECHAIIGVNSRLKNPFMSFLSSVIGIIAGAVVVAGTVAGAALGACVGLNPASILAGAACGAGFGLGISLVPMGLFALRQAKKKNVDNKFSELEEDIRSFMAPQA